MDVTFKTPEGVFNYRVCGLLVHENKLLTMKNVVNGQEADYAYLPGGRVHLHETAEEAILREMEEELNIPAKIARPLWLNESFFPAENRETNVHELCFYFLMDHTGTDLLSYGQQFYRYDEANNQFVFEWTPFEKLKEMNVYPGFIKEAIFDLPQQLTMHYEKEYDN